MGDGWSVASPASVGLSSDSLARLHAAIQAGEFGNMTSVLVARGGDLVHEAYYGGSEATLRNTRSVTKTLASMLVGIAIGDGDLSGVDAPVLPHLRQRPALNLDPRKAEITVQDLLSMSSILECDDWNQQSAGQEDRMYLREDWTQFALDLPIKGTLPWEPPAEERPYGRVFNYCTAGAHLVGRVVEGASGETVGAMAQERLFGPLGITSVDWQMTAKGEHNVAGGLGLRSRDLLKLGQVYASGGTWNGRRVVPEFWVRESVRPRAVFYGPDGSEYQYGYLWWLRTLEIGGQSVPTVYMSGTGGNRVTLVPSLDLVVVITGEGYQDGRSHGHADRLLSDYVVPAAM